MVVRKAHLAGKNLRFSTIVNRWSQPNYLTKHLSFYTHKAFLKFIVRVLQSHKGSSAFLLRRLSPAPPKSALLYYRYRLYNEYLSIKLGKETARSKSNITKSLINTSCPVFIFPPSATRSARNRYYTVVWDHVRCFQSRSEGIYYLCLQVVLLTYA